MKDGEELVYSGQGYCPICEREVVFSAKKSWFREHLLCSGCGSIPRERALMRVITDCFPDYRELIIHESSPAARGVSSKLKEYCPGYSSSHYFEQVPSGQADPRTGFRCESVEDLTFADNSFDLFVTQDVMEHIFSPNRAFGEISRVLKPGGAHIFTVPIVNKHKASEVWASRDENGEIVFHGPAEYHGNGMGERTSLVTMHWGYDIVWYISKASGMSSSILTIDDLSQGIQADLVDVVVSRRPAD